MSGNVFRLSPEVVASWPAPNYDNPPRKTWYPIYSSIWFAASTFMVAMRYWLRARGFAGRLGLDDAIMFPAWLAGLMFTVATTVFTQRAQGDRHIWDVTPDARVFGVFCMWLGELSFLICAGCTKVSVLFFYRRLVEGTYSRRWTWLVWVAVSFTVAYTFAFCVALLLKCSPTDAYWKAFDIEYNYGHKYTCLDTTSINAISGACAVFGDTRQKIALNVIFSLGFIVIIASCIRTYWLMKLGHSNDATRCAFETSVWAQFELQAGIMCASAPSLRGFVRYLSRSNSPRNDTRRSAITVVRDTTLTFGALSPVEMSRSNRDVHETNVQKTSASEDSLLSPTLSQARLVQSSHEEDTYIMGHMSWRDPVEQSRGAWMEGSSAGTMSARGE